MNRSSAGNYGESIDGPFHTIGAPASCKNTLAIGATFNAEFGHEDAVASFSSRGPTFDGRIKPDILAPGFRLSSAIAGHHECSRPEAEFLRAGTSMAAPVVSGSALLIRQYFEEAFYPCGFRGCGKRIDPSGSLIKAVLINGGQTQKQVVHASSGYVRTDQPTSPYDNTQGFGAANLLLSLPVKESDFGIYVLDKKAVRLGKQHSFELEIDETCKSDLSITLAWTDPPATIGCVSCLVNDLDLVVEDVSTSTKHYPNGRTTPDRTNNVERVRIDNDKLASGQRYRVSVSANHLGPQYNLQHFSLVATGCFLSPDSKSSNQSHTPVATYSTVHELETSYRLLNKYRASGIMFSVKARSSGVVVNSFSITTQLEEDNTIYVYKLKDTGHHLDTSELNNETLWEIISPSNGFHVNATRTRDLTVLPSDAFNVHIPKGLSQSFYITFAKNDKAIVCGRPRWANKQTRQKKRDDNIRIEGGIGRARPFAGRTIDPCYLDGSVMYTVEESLFV